MTPEEICKMAANGDSFAERYCASWVAVCHAFDHCFDRDHPPDDNALAAAFAGYILELAGNPFFQVNKASLIGLMVQSLRAWADSNRLTGDARHVLAGMYHEVVYHVAFIKGGWKHMSNVTAECREYKGVT